MTRISRFKLLDPSKKRSQMEIMGLMIVVILVIIGVLFVLKFVILKPPSEVKKSFLTSQLVSNFGIALLHSSSEDCRGTDLSELMIDCTNWYASGGGITCGNGMKSCEYVQDVISGLINQTFEAWHVKYYIRAGTSKSDAGEIFSFSSKDKDGESNCNDKVPGESEQFFLPTDRGLLTLKIFICN